MLSRRASSERIATALDDALLKGEASRIATRGSGDRDKGEAAVTHRYEIAPATHATIETATATARIEDGKLELWVATQAPAQAKAAAAKAIGMGADEAVLYPVAAGGSFDRRLEHDHAIEAAVIAAEIGANVDVARRGGLLHDLGKAIDHEVEGTHALLGADIARRYNVNPAVVHCIEAHHEEVEPSTVEAIVVMIADAAKK